MVEFLKYLPKTKRPTYMNTETLKVFSEPWMYKSGGFDTSKLIELFSRRELDINLITRKDKDAICKAFNDNCPNASILIHKAKDLKDGYWRVFRRPSEGYYLVDVLDSLKVFWILRIQDEKVIAYPMDSDTLEKIELNINHLPENFICTPKKPVVI